MWGIEGSGIYLPSGIYYIREFGLPKFRFPINLWIYSRHLGFIPDLRKFILEIRKFIHYVWDVRKFINYVWDVREFIHSLGNLFPSLGTLISTLVNLFPTFGNLLTFGYYWHSGIYSRPMGIYSYAREFITDLRGFIDLQKFILRPLWGLFLHSGIYPRLSGINSRHELI